MKGLLDGVDGVVRGSALVCCNQNAVTVKQCSLSWRNANLLCIYKKLTEGKSLWISLHSHIQPEECNTDRGFSWVFFTLSTKSDSSTSFSILSCLSTYPHLILQFVNFFCELRNNKIITDLQHQRLRMQSQSKVLKYVLILIQHFSISLALSDNKTVTPSRLEFSITSQIQFLLTFHVLQPSWDHVVIK
jgi:hypothetical protein